MSLSHAGPVRPQQASWSDRWFDWRNRTLASPGFQQAAARWWPTRRVARARAGEVFDLVAGFVYSQVLFACVKLRLLEHLADGALTLPVVADRVGLTRDAALRLLEAARALRLVQERPGDRWGLGVRGATVAGNPAIRAMVEHHAIVYRDLADPVALLQGSEGKLGSYWPYARADRPADLPAEAVATYSSLMSESQPLVAGEVLGAHSFAGHSCVLDVGGGEGAFLQAVGRAHPHLRRMLFDLPAVASRAQARLGAGVVAHGGDFLRDDLPRGADVVTLVRVIHDHDDAAVRALLSNVRKAVAPGAGLVIAEPLARTEGADAMGDAYFGFYLLAMGSGRPRTYESIRQLLEEAGFGAVRRRPTRFPLQASVVVATAV